MSLLSRSLLLLALFSSVWAAAVAAAPRAAGAPADEPPLFDPGTLREYHLTFDVSNWRAALTQAGDTGNVPAELEVDGQLYEEIGVRYKGLSSSRVQSDKKPLNLTIDAFVPGQRLMGYDIVNLNNGYGDPSAVREHLTNEALRTFMPVQRTAFAKVYVNGQYLGLYLAAEQIEGTYLGENFPDSDGILIKADAPGGGGPQPRLVAARSRAVARTGAEPSPDVLASSGVAASGGSAARPGVDGGPGRATRTGDLAPAQGPGPGAGMRSALQWLGEDLSQYRAAYEVKTDGAEDAGYTALRELTRVLGAPTSAGGVSDADFPATIGQVLDVDRALWFLAANNLFVNFDTYYFGHNYFLYLAEEDDQFHLLVWDTSLSLGAFAVAGAAPSGPPAQSDPFHMQNDATRPLIRRLLAVPELRADYIAHFRALAEEALVLADLETGGTAAQALIRPALEVDPNRLYNLDAFDRNLRADVTGVNSPAGRTVPGVLKLVEERLAWLATQPSFAAPDHRLLQHTRAPEAPRPDEAAAVTLRFAGSDAAVDVRLVYRVDHGPPQTVVLAGGGGAWDGQLPGQAPGSLVEYYARVAFADGRSAFYPPANLTQSWRYAVAGPDLPVQPGGSLLMNELMADNDNVVADPAGQYDDWVELYNAGTEPIPLSGYYLGKDAADPWAYAFPDVTLPPGGFYLVWCDKDPEQGPDHADFQLGKDGDTVLLSTQAAIVGEVTFGPQETDLSYARLPDGADTWVTCQSPTAGASNVCEDRPTPTATEPLPPTATPTRTPTGAARTPTPTASPTSGPPVLPRHWFIPFAGKGGR